MLNGKLSINSIYTKEQVWEFLSEIPDPEIPVITITELGVVRSVEISENIAVITITPTYTGCPAMKLFEDEIVSTLKNNLSKSFISKSFGSCKCCFCDQYIK